jgi:hypothetical protein
MKNDGLMKVNLISQSPFSHPVTIAKRISEKQKKTRYTSNLPCWQWLSCPNPSGKITVGGNFGTGPGLTNLSKHGSKVAMYCPLVLRLWVYHPCKVRGMSSYHSCIWMDCQKQQSEIRSVDVFCIWHFPLLTVFEKKTTHQTKPWWNKDMCFFMFEDPGMAICFGCFMSFEYGFVWVSSGLSSFSLFNLPSTGVNSICSIPPRYQVSLTNIPIIFSMSLVIKCYKSPISTWLLLKYPINIP